MTFTKDELKWAFDVRRITVVDDHVRIMKSKDGFYVVLMVGKNRGFELYNGTTGKIEEVCVYWLDFFSAEGLRGTKTITNPIELEMWVAHIEKNFPECSQTTTIVEALSKPLKED